MEIINKLLKDKIIIKSSDNANSDVCQMILKNIVKDYEKDDYNIFKEETSFDEKIDLYLFWKNMMTSIIETKITTQNYSFKHYSCCFLDDNLFSIYLTYIMYEGKLYDISVDNQY